MPALLEMAAAAHVESVQRDLPLNLEKVRACFLRWMAADLFIVAMRDGHPVGFLIGFVSPHWFSDALGAWDRLLYVRPEARGSRAAYALYGAFREWARAKGAADLWPGVSTGSATAISFYRRLGLREVGALFCETLSQV
jgi:GNAT superfamily N-acetyltransferase